MATTNHPLDRGSFHTFAGRASLIVGSKWAFTTAVLIILFWGLSGPYFHFSDTWQLVVNTATTIVTFLIVFLIQNTQNRDARAIHLKLDEIIHSLKGARNEMMQIEQLSDAQLEIITKNKSAPNANAALPPKNPPPQNELERQPPHGLRAQDCFIALPVALGRWEFRLGGDRRRRPG